MDISNVSSAVTSGLNGYKAAEQSIEQSSANINRLQVERQNAAENARAEDIPEPTTVAQRPPVSLEAEAVNLVVSEHLAKANINVIKTADDVVGTLIDTKA
jgi:hypothetical protein